jgi:Zn-dependent protease/CBS domain-containing protein
VEIFDIFGFKLRIDPSWLLIAALVVWSLSTSYFPEAVTGLSRGEYIALSIIAMFGLFASLIFHELAHSLVARRFGLQVGSITLFIFGGVAELEHEPRDAVSEFWIAIAGPVASLTLAGFAFMIVDYQSPPHEAVSLEAVISYLGMMNLVLAFFNLVPAFPLDGGRILRAALWKYKGDLLWATRIASSFGTVFGMMLILLGALSIFSNMGVGGFWQILIGFFIMSASSASYAQLQMKTILRNQRVASLMTRDPITANASDTLDYLVDKVMLEHNVSFVPVVDGDHLLGYVDTVIVQRIDRENWPSTRLDDVYVPCGPGNTVAEDMPTEKLFEIMARNGQRKFLISDNSRLSGVISLADMLTYLAIHQGLGKINTAAKA